ncbi:hypothetical protein H311_01801 [Anncaliia algerae PRA109]|nr:hypothetical protein H311_01801 [Anncaliia algerae PRA109]
MKFLTLFLIKWLLKFTYASENPQIRVVIIDDNSEIQPSSWFNCLATNQTKILNKQQEIYQKKESDYNYQKLREKAKGDSSNHIENPLRRKKQSDQVKGYYRNNDNEFPETRNRKNTSSLVYTCIPIGLMAVFILWYFLF